MKPGLLATKIGMTQVMDDRGTVVPVTVLQAGPCVVLQVKTKESDGYDSVQIGFQDVKPHRSTKPMIGHAAKVGSGPKRRIRELRLDQPADVSPGDVLRVNTFSDPRVSYVDVTGTTKGKGYQGVMKRHGFGGMCASHGTERKHRSPGGIGANAPRGTGQSVKKGKRMAGHMGNVRATASTLRLVSVDGEHDLLIVAGSVPGPNGGVVLVQPAKRKR